MSIKSPNSVEKYEAKCKQGLQVYCLWIFRI